MGTVLPFPRAGDAEGEDLIRALTLIVAGVVEPAQVSLLVAVPKDELLKILSDRRRKSGFGRDRAGHRFIASFGREFPQRYAYLNG